MPEPLSCLQMIILSFPKFYFLHPIKVCLPNNRPILILSHLRIRDVSYTSHLMQVGVLAFYQFTEIHYSIFKTLNSQSNRLNPILTKLELNLMFHEFLVTSFINNNIPLSNNIFMYLVSVK